MHVYLFHECIFLWCIFSWKSSQKWSYRISRTMKLSVTMKHDDVGSSLIDDHRIGPFINLRILVLSLLVKFLVAYNNQWNQYFTFFFMTSNCNLLFSLQFCWHLCFFPGTNKGPFLSRSSFIFYFLNDFRGWLILHHVTEVMCVFILVWKRWLIDATATSRPSIQGRRLSYFRSRLLFFIGQIKFEPNEKTDIQQIDHSI